MESIFRYNCKLEEGAYTRGGAYNRMHSFCIKVEPIIGGPITGRGAFKGKFTVIEYFYTKKENRSSSFARARLPKHPTIIPSHWFAMISAAFKEKIISVRLSVVKNVNLVLSTVLPVLKMNPLKVFVETNLCGWFQTLNVTGFPGAYLRTVSRKSR